MAKPIDRGNGFYELRARIWTNPETGRPEYLYGTFKGGPRKAQEKQDELQAEARKERAQREARARGEQVTDDGVMTVADALEAYWDDHGADVDAPDTVRNHIDNYLMPGLGTVDLTLLRGQLTRKAAKLNPHLVDISAFYRGIKLVTDEESAAAASYVRRIHATFRAALQHAVREGWLAQNPAADAKLPTVRKRPSTTPEAVDLAVFLTRMRDRHHRLYVFALLVGSGVRNVEAYALRWRHFDLDAGVLTTDASGVVRTKSGAPGGRESSELREGETKKRRIRTIVLDPVALAAVRAHRRHCIEYAMAAGVKVRTGSFLFSLDPDGASPQRAGWATQAWGRHRTTAIRDGLAIPPEVRLYDTRHFLGTQALSKGHSPSEVAMRMGNSAKTVTDFYGHGTRAGDQAIAADMGEAWGIT